ncbi:MAG TPA: phosphatidylglycerol lysyltransferase domain-containing protein [Actinomycetales bacterium]|nr:phosphatidylglycerol lysyltransferase domain-containing protein [Actinomycetales bacterium]
MATDDREARDRPNGDTRSDAAASPPAAAQVRRRVPTLVAWVVRAVALLSLVSLFSRHGREHGRFGDALLDGVSMVVAIGLAAVMLVLARGVARRKRRAWRLVLGLVVVATVLYTRHRTWEAAGLNAAMVGLLLWTRDEFDAQSEPSSRWLALRAGVLTALVSFGAGMALNARSAPDADSWSVVWETARGLVGFVPDLPYRRPALGTLTNVVLSGLGVLTAGVVLAILLAPRRKPAVLEDDEERRLRDLLARHGDGDSLGYFALRRDKSAIFSRSGLAAVTYRVVDGVSLASGDPVGDPEAWPGAISAWLEEAERFAWTPGVLGASQKGARAYVRAGLDALEIGDEAVVDLTSFTLDGRDMRGVRQAVARVRRSGATADVTRQRDLSPAELAEVCTAVDALRDGDVERGFSMALGRVGDAADGDVVVVRGYDSAGVLVALLSLVPWGVDGLSLDVMRRSRDSENGMLEFLVATLADQASALGIRRLSLNFAVFRSALERGGEVGAGPVLRLWRSLLLGASRWWQIESLYRANAKYRPEWVPRFLCFPRATAAARVAVAALQAEAFIVRPTLSRWWRPRR